MIKNTVTVSAVMMCFYNFNKTKITRLVSIHRCTLSCEGITILRTIKWGICPWDTVTQMMPLLAHNVIKGHNSGTVKVMIHKCVLDLTVISIVKYHIYATTCILFESYFHSSLGFFNHCSKICVQ